MEKGRVAALFFPITLEKKKKKKRSKSYVNVCVCFMRWSTFKLKEEENVYDVLFY
jgi:hypothetical protein